MQVKEVLAVLRSLRPCALGIALLMAVVSGSIAFSDGGAGAATVQTLVVGNLETMTGGSFSAYGISSTQGAEIAIQQINATGGIKVGGTQYKLQLQTEDDQGKPEVAVARFKAMQAQGIKFFVGPSGSTVLNALEPYWAKANGIFISSGATEPHLTDGKPNVFGTVYKHTDLAKASVWFFRVHQSAYKRAAVIADSSSTALSEAWTDTFVADWKASGGIVTTVVYGKGTDQTDFYPQLTAIINGKPDVVASGQSYKPNATSVKQARQLGLTVPFISTSGGAPQEADIAGDAINGTYTTSALNLNFLVAQGSSPARQLADEYQKNYGQPLDDLLGNFSSMYTAIYALARALEASGTISKISTIEDALHNVKIASLPPVVAAKYSPSETSGALFDSTRWAHMKIAILEWTARKLQVAATAP